MTELIQKRLNDSKALRWSVLIMVSFTMMCCYILCDIMSPLQTILEQEMMWDRLDFGFFNSAYGWFNIFLLMLIFGGIILDKMGVRFTGMGACILMVVGCAIKYYAVSTVFPEGATIFGFKSQVFIAAFGYAVFGVGAEIAGITVSKVIVKWFNGKEMALAMGVQVATARIGTAIALGAAVPVAKYFGTTDQEGVFHPSVSMPILLCLIMLCIGTVAYFVYMFYDRKLDASLSAAAEEPEEPFRVKDIVGIVSNKGFWLIALLCLLFYAAVFPFIKYATDLMMQKYNVDPELAGTIPSLLPFGTIFLTPLFGSLYDRIGKGATLMIAGSMMLIVVHVLFALPILDYWWFAALIMFVLGIAFSLVPSALWPSVPKIIPERQIGTAYALIFWVQNWGLSGVPLFIGWELEAFCKTDIVDGVQMYDYTIPMLTFAALGALSLLVGLMLKAEDKKKGYGLELPNIKK
jgi:nitrate/nitrite transporter NarK